MYVVSEAGKKVQIDSSKHHKTTCYPIFSKSSVCIHIIICHTYIYIHNSVYISIYARSIMVSSMVLFCLPRCQDKEVLKIIQHAADRRVVRSLVWRHIEAHILVMFNIHEPTVSRQLNRHVQLINMI